MASDELPILVGVDGSEQSQAAIDLGVREARLRGRSLRLVHAFVWRELGVYVGPSPEGPPDGGLLNDAKRLLDGALARARASAGDTPVTAELIDGPVVPVLLREAERAELVVLGNRGLGGFTGLLVGSVAVELAAHAPGPVLVARGTIRADGPVVVGVDPDADTLAVDFAFEAAAARDAELVAIHAWSGRLADEDEAELPLIYEPSDVQREQERRLTEFIAEARARYPGVRVRPQVQPGRPARILVEASKSAQLVVVGARGRGGFAGLLLGSVSQALLHHAHCPVAIARRQPSRVG
ncbi:MAG TPA: universal stress protein [Natronosporangium sp.]